MSRVRLGLLRDSAAPSLSPRIFEWAFQTTGVDGEYKLYSLTADAVPEFLARGEWDGLNVTIPHKTLVFDLCRETTPRAQQAGAVNTLYRREDILWGDNTDIPGYTYALLRALPPGLAVEKALLIGTGGAARAVLMSLSESVLSPEVTVATRDVEGARARLGNLEPAVESLDFSSLANAAVRLKEFDLVIQASPVGSPRIAGVPLPGDLTFKSGALVMDLIYSPPETEFLRQARHGGAVVENGLVMLIAQAAESFEIWTGTPFPLELAMRELLPQLRAL